MIIPKNASTIPNQFKPYKKGLANKVFIDRKCKMILKIYLKNEYYQSELLVSDTGFLHMPRILEKGTINKQKYIIMTYIGKPIKKMTELRYKKIAKTMVTLHNFKSIKKDSLYKEKFNLFRAHHNIIFNTFNIDINKHLNRLEVYIKSHKKFLLIHGDITLSNLRCVSKEIFLIDFDEALYFLPEFEIAKLYWSDMKQLKNINGIKNFINIYNIESNKKIIFDNRMYEWILFAGIDFWLWRYLHIKNKIPNALLEAQKHVSIFYKKYYDTR